MGCQKRLRRKIYCFHNSFYWEQPLLCCTHLHFEKCAIRIGPTGKRTPSAQMPALFIFCWTGKQFKCHWLWWRWWWWWTIKMQQLCSTGTVLQGPAVRSVTKFVKLHNLANLKRQNEDIFIHQIQEKVHFFSALLTKTKALVYILLLVLCNFLVVLNCIKFLIIYSFNAYFYVWFLSVGHANSAVFITQITWIIYKVRNLCLYHSFFDCFDILYSFSTKPHSLNTQIKSHTLHTVNDDCIYKYRCFIKHIYWLRINATTEKLLQTGRNEDGCHKKSIWLDQGIFERIKDIYLVCDTAWWNSV